MWYLFVFDFANKFRVTDNLLIIFIMPHALYLCAYGIIFLKSTY